MLEELIAFLRFHDFPVGVDTHLKVAHLLERTGSHYPTSRLKTLLAPLFASDAFQQEEFYRLYDAYLAKFPLQEESSRVSNSTTSGKAQAPGWTLKTFSRRRIYIILQLLFLALVGIAGFRSLDCYLETRSLRQTWQCVLDTQPLSRQGPPEVPAQDSSLWEVESPLVTEQGSDQDTPPIPHSSDSLLRRKKSSAYLSQQIRLEPADPIKPDLSSLQKPWYTRYELILRILVALFFLSFAVLVEIRDRLKKRLMMVEDRRRKPPLFWKAKPAQSPNALQQSREFFEAARVLREREPFLSKEIDVERTVEQSTEQGGILDLAYQVHSRPPEYLVLIEQKTPKDLLAQLYQHLCQELRQQDLYLDRYFFDGDPRICWQERYADEHYLEDLLRQLPQHRVVIIGDSELFFDPMGDNLANWIPMLDRPKPVFIMTPKSPSAWGWREKVLQDQFLLLPATIDGLARIPEVLTKSTPASMRYWQQFGSYPPIGDEVEKWTIKDLELYFNQCSQLTNNQPLNIPTGKQILNWCCACGVHSELSWELILRLAGALEEEGHSLRSPQALYQLLRLPWFRQGEIPVEMREAMTEHLDDESLRKTRETIIDVLKKNPPPEGSYAYDEYQLLLRVQEAELQGGLRHNFEALQEVWDYALHHEVEDETVLKYLETLPTKRIGIWWILPKSWNDLLFRQGLPALGFKAWVRGSLALAAMLLVLLTFRGYEWQNWQRYEKQWFYLENDADRARYYTYVGIDLQEQNLPNGARRFFQLANDYAQNPGQDPYLEPAYNLALLTWKQEDFIRQTLALDGLRDLNQQLEALLADSTLTIEKRSSYQQLYARSQYSLGAMEFYRQDTEAALLAFREANKADDQQHLARLGEALTLVQQSTTLDESSSADKLGLALERLGEVGNVEPGFLGKQQALIGVLDSLESQEKSPVVQSRYQQLMAVARGQEIPALTDPETLETKPSINISDLRDKDLKLVTDFSNGLAVIEYQGKYGFINRQNQLVGGITYEDAHGFSEGLAAVKRDGRWGYVNPVQELIIPYEYQRAEDFRDGRAAVRNERGFWGVIDQSGKRVLPLTYEKPVTFEPESQLPPGAEPLAVTFVTRQPEGKYVFIGLDGKPAFGNKLFQYAENFRGNYARVVRYDRSYYIDRQGNCYSDVEEPMDCPSVKWGQQLLRQITAHEKPVIAANFSLNGRQLITGSLDSTVRVWNGQGSGQGTVLKHKDWVRALAQTPDGSRIFTGSRDGTFTMWSPQGQALGSRTFGGNQPVEIVFHPTSSLLLAGLSNGAIVRLNPQNLEILQTWRIPRQLTPTAIATNGDLVAAVAQDGVLRVWKLGGGDQIQASLGGSLYSVAISPDGQKIATGNNRGEVFILNTEDLSPVAQVQPHSSQVLSVEFSPFDNGGYLLSGSRDRTVKIINLSDLQPVLSIKLRATLTTAQFSPAGAQLLVATQGPTGRGLDQVLLFNLDRY